MLAAELGLYLNLQLRDLLLELCHGSNVVSFPQPHSHYFFLTLQKKKTSALQFKHSFFHQVHKLKFTACTTTELWWLVPAEVVLKRYSRLFVPCIQSQLASA